MKSSGMTVFVTPGKLVRSTGKPELCIDEEFRPEGYLDKSEAIYRNGTSSVN
jgi:hypothetical protein